MYHRMKNKLLSYTEIWYNTHFKNYLWIWVNKIEIRFSRSRGLHKFFSSFLGPDCELDPPHRMRLCREVLRFPVCLTVPVVNHTVR